MDDELLNWLIFTKKFDGRIIFSIALKIAVSQIGAHFLNNEIEKYLEKEIQSTMLTKHAITRKSIFLKIYKNFNKLKYALNLVLLGLILPVNGQKIIDSLLKLLKYLFSKIVRRPPNPPVKKDPLPEIIKVALEKSKEPTIKIADKVKVKVDQIRFERECQLIKEFVLTQKELLAEMNNGKGVKETVGERVTRYCTTKITTAVKKVILKIQNQPISEGIRVVLEQGDKVNTGLDVLQIALNNGEPRNPRDLIKYIQLSKDLAFTMKCLDSYSAVIKNGVTPENLDYLREKILPDLFVILVAMRREMKK